jgi:conjugal transfer pilus assembly protein TraF
MLRRIILLPVICILTIQSSVLFAQNAESGDDYIAKKNQTTKPVRAAGQDDLGWNFYFPDKLETPQEITKVPPPPPPPQASGSEKPIKPMSVEWFREHYPTIRDRAINNPSPENLAAELFSQKVMLDKSEVYGRKRQFVQSTEPYLQEGVRLPMFGAANTAMVSESLSLKKEALTDVFKETGLIVFYDHTCEYCKKIIPTINYIKQTYPDFDVRIMARNTPKPDQIPGVRDEIPIYPDEIFRVAENLPTPIQYWPAFVLTVPPNDAYIVAQGAVPRTELFNRILNVSFEERILGKDWYDKIYKNQSGLISTSAYAALASGVEDDPVALVNAVVEMIKNSDGSLYDELIGTGDGKND